MTIKTILAAASGGTASEGAIELACRLARHFEAHVEGFHAKADIMDLFTNAGVGLGMPMAGEFVDTFITDADSLAAKTGAAFRSTIGRFGIPMASASRDGSSASPIASASWREETGHGPSVVARRARFFDLVVLGRSERVIDHYHTDAVEQVLVHAGRPVLLAPAATPERISDVVAVGWDGSAEAVRALAGALPFLALSRSSKIITIGDKHKESAEALVQYLDWHGIAAKHRNESAITGAGLGEQLLAAARDEGADLLAMGGYGHVPWREFLFGGATREIVGVSLLPLLLSH